MKLEARTNGPVVIVEVEGPLDSETGGAAELLARLREILDGEASCLLLDVGQIPTADSLTLGAFVQAHVSAVRRGRTLKLLHVRPRLRELLRVTKLDRAIELFDSEEAAVASVVPHA